MVVGSLGLEDIVRFLLYGGDVLLFLPSDCVFFSSSLLSFYLTYA